MDLTARLLDHLVFGSSVRQWIVALAISAVVFAGLFGVRWLLGARLAKLAGRTSNQLDDILLELVRKTHAVFLAIVALSIGVNTLDSAAPIGRAIRILVVVGLVLQGARWGTSAITGLVGIRTARVSGTDPAQVTTLNALGLLIRLALYSVLLLLALSNFGIDVTALVAGLGIGGIAIALALQNILGDLFGSLSIVLDKPFVVGDFIVFGDFLGTVEHVGLKTTRLRSLSGEQLVCANGDLLSSRIRNFKRMTERRAVFSIGVAYETDPGRVAAIPTELRDIIEQEPKTRFDRAHFRRFGDSSLEFEVVYWILDPDYNLYMDIQQRINLGILARLADSGVAFAYPTQTVYLHRLGVPSEPDAP